MLNRSYYNTRNFIYLIPSILIFETTCFVLISFSLFIATFLIKKNSKNQLYNIELYGQNDSEITESVTYFI